MICSLVFSLQLAKATETRVQNNPISSSAPTPNQTPNTTSVARLEVGAKRLDTPQSVVNGNIAVLFPKTPEAARQFFSKIMEGIEERTKSKLTKYPLDTEKSDNPNLSEQLKHNDTRVVIALGRSAVMATSGLDHGIPVIAGGILVNEQDHQTMNGISMTPDPALLFQRLRILMPDVKRVWVVYNPQQNESLIKLARESARLQGLELVSHEARDLAAAAKTYEMIFSNSSLQHDAIWLPNDQTSVEEKTILPLILKQAWSSSVPVFASSLIHVKRGALFALYPNQFELGKGLANSALGIMAGESRKKGMQPLREVLAAINVRTASHIGLQIDLQQQRLYDSVFPEP
jgi:putative ABC transport system substrate-binding protein